MLRPATLPADRPIQLSRGCVKVAAGCSFFDVMVRHVGSIGLTSRSDAADSFLHMMRVSSTITYALAAFLPLALFVAVPFSGGEQLYLLGLFAIAASWLASALYVLFALRSPTVPSSKRSLWVTAIFFGSALVLPFFWYWYVWGGGREADA